MSNEVLVEASNCLVSYLEHLYPTWSGLRQFKGTPERLCRMYEDFCWPEERVKEELDKQFKVFEDGYNEMLVKKNINVWTLCPHHLLPCNFKVNVGYIPTPGRILGLSKLSRIAEILAKRPIIQEQYCTELADVLMEKLEPKGVAVYVVGRHGCISARGVKQESDVVTSVVRGDFLKEDATRGEFFSICRS